MQRLDTLTPLFFDMRGDPLDAGFVYIGTAGQDPTLHAIPTYWDSALTEAAPQPLRTLGGMIVNGETPAQVYLADGDFSQQVTDSEGVIIAPYSFPSAAAITGAGGGASYQPLNAALTALAGNGTPTSFGLSLLLLANLTALKTMIGNSGGLPLTGGTVTGNIVRSGAGIHPYFADAAMTGARIFVTAVGAADPTSQPGDLWLAYTP